MNIRQFIRKCIYTCFPHNSALFIHRLQKISLSLRAISNRSGVIRYLYSRKVFRKYYGNMNGGNVFAWGGGNNLSKKIIYMADGISFRGGGGLADRLRGMVSLYRISQDIGVEFKINFTSPAQLTDYLVPNEYDWTVDKSEITYDVRESVICRFSHNITLMEAETTIRRLLKRYNQILISTNMTIADKEYGMIFNCLFKPSWKLDKLIEYNLSNTGNDFISATFRFQALLGDFFEGEYPVLSENDRAAYINRCLDHLDEIHRENEGKKILVTSDSITFLNAAKKFEYVYVIPGEIAHIGYSPGLASDVYMKSFVDYFMLTHSQKIYLVIDGKMFDSGFAHRASLHKTNYVVKRYE